METRLDDKAIQDRFRDWTVYWRLDQFSVRNPQDETAGSFSYRRIILPVEIEVEKANRMTGRAILKLDPAWRAELLIGAPITELERFKRTVSVHVLAAVRLSPFGCSDCAREARMSAFMWDGNPCPACRQFYCRNPKCLRRLKLGDTHERRVECPHCGEENRPGSSATRTRFQKDPFIHLL